MLQDIFEEGKKLATNEYERLSLAQSDSWKVYKNHLNENIDTFFKGEKEKNYNESNEKCKKALTDLFSKLEVKISVEYSEPNNKGLENLKADIEILKQQYSALSSNTELGPAKADALKKFESKEVHYFKLKMPHHKFTSHFVKNFEQLYW